MEKPLVAFAAIVKDEAANFRKTLESVVGVVDLVVVLDTGSTDGTQDVVRAFAKDHLDLPTYLYEEPFVDFSVSRNRALETAEAFHPVFTLMLSGDEVLTEESRKPLRAWFERAGDIDTDVGAYCVEMMSGTQTWPFPRVLRVGGGWRYEDDVHETPQGPNGELVDPDHTTILGVRVIHAASDPERRAKRAREYDLPRLEKRVADKTASLDKRAQAIWFLAQTYEALADVEPREPGGEWLSLKMQAMALYWRRGELGFDPVKSHYAIFRYLNVAESIGFYNDRELVNRLEPLVHLEPRQPEIRYMLAAHASKIDARKGAYLALEAAKVAREARERPTHMPTDVRCEWLSLRIAAECAKVLGSAGRAREAALRALEVGGPREVFAEYLGEAS